jgi:hypothetical protein
MLHIITGYFDTRREAEMTVEHLAQENGLDRRFCQRSRQRCRHAPADVSAYPAWKIASTSVARRR